MRKSGAVFSVVVLLISSSCATRRKEGERPPPEPAAAAEEDAELVHRFETLTPQAKRDPATGTITVDLDALRQGLVPYLKRTGLEPDRFRVYMNGAPQREERIDGGAATVVMESLPLNAQPYVDVEVLGAGGEVLHVTDPALFESLDLPLFSVAQPTAVEATGPGVEPSMIRTATEIQQRKGSWFLRPTVKSTNPALYQAFLQHGSKLEVVVTPTPEKRVSVSYLDPESGTKHAVPASPEDFYFTANADFSWHLFDWDRWLAGRYLRFYEPWLARDTVDLALATQQPNGAFWRELTFYLTSYQRPYTVKLGRRVFNREAFNPPLMGWAVTEMVGWDPGMAKVFVPRVADALRRQREWLEKEPEVVVRQNGKIIGFRWTSLGSGRDNAFRGDLFVDLMTYYKMLLDQERVFRTMLGQHDAADALARASQEGAATLNDEYWDDAREMYVDLVATPDGKGYTRDTTLNAVGFWPAMASVPDRLRLERLVDNLRDPRRFGGPFLPSLARDDPRMNEVGNYWRGGGWPPDFAFLLDALMRNGLRGEARRETLRMLSATKEASSAYKLGHTPALAITGDLPAHAGRALDDPDVRKALARHPEAEASLRRGEMPDAMGAVLHDPEVRRALEKYPDTVWETVGLWADARGERYVTWGKEIRSDESLHETRGGGEPGGPKHGFAGWGAVPVEAIRSGLGLDAVPPLAVATASDDELTRWYRFLATDPTMRYHYVDANPDLPRIDAGAAATRPRQADELRQRRELARLARGYLALSPAYDPGVGRTSFQGLAYDDVPFTMKVDRVGKDRVRLSVTSKRPIGVQINRHWTTSGEACDVPLAASSIIEVGGSRKVVDVTLSPTYRVPERTTAAAGGAPSECALAVAAVGGRR